MFHKTLLQTAFLAVLTVTALGFTVLDCAVIIAADAAATPKTVKKTKAPRGILPPYYSKVVTQDQREKIYTIQAEYRQKIEEARAQLNSLIDEQKEKISAVLSDVQKKQIEEARSAANAKRAAKKTDLQKAEKDPGIDMQEMPKTD